MIKVIKVSAVVLVAIEAIVILAISQQIYYAAVIGPVLITILVINAMRSLTPSIQSADSLEVPHLYQDTRQTLITFYEQATYMHVETDQGMYQIVRIFVPASLLMLGWILSNPNCSEITAEVTAVIGSTTIVLVGVATLIKHRLRYFNKLREIYLRKLEGNLINQELNLNLGLHNFLKNVYTPTGTSFHAVIDIYYFLHIGVWIILWYSKL